MTGAPEAHARLRRALSPASVAVLGASPRPESLSRRFLSGLVRHGFAGTIVAVNPNYDEVDGIRCVPSVGDAGAIDLAVLSVPKRLVLSSLEECAAAGVAGAVVFASGYSETGDRGREDELEITELARRTGLRVLGPNSPGLIDLTHSCCVIASGVGGVASVIRHGETGLIVPPQNSGELARRILELLDQPTRARALGARARQMVVDVYNVESMVKKTVQVYRDVVAAEPLPTAATQHSN